MNNKFSVNNESTVTGIRCEIYKVLHDLEWSLHNAPLDLIENPKRILNKVKEALQICESSHTEKREQKEKKDEP